jgi:transcription elongation factor Elf1
MAKEKATKETTKGITFHCKFCGESRPLSEMSFMTHLFPIMVVCRGCENALQALKPEEEAPAELVEETAEEEAPSDIAA